MLLVLLAADSYSLRTNQEIEEERSPEDDDDDDDDDNMIAPAAFALALVPIGPTTTPELLLPFTVSPCFPLAIEWGCG